MKYIATLLVTQGVRVNVQAETEAEALVLLRQLDRPPEDTQVGDPPWNEVKVTGIVAVPEEAE